MGCRHLVPLGFLPHARLQVRGVLVHDTRNVAPLECRGVCAVPFVSYHSTHML